ncbi:MAG: RsmE family RNA methyltransferase [Desulfobacterales bacterium]
MRLFFIDAEELQRREPAIYGGDVQHIRNVLRLGPGDRIGLLDGDGMAYDARIRSLSPQKVTVTILNAFRHPNPPEGSIGIAQALLKDKKMDGLIRQLTELGITDWLPFISERSVSRPDAYRWQRRIERWRSISREAVKQCRRPTVPRIYDPMDWDALLAASGDWDHKFLFWERARHPFDRLNIVADNRNHRHRVLLVMGPEGGFSEKEAVRAEDWGFVPLSLGPRILRAETATISACTLAQYFLGGFQTGGGLHPTI